LYAPFLKKYYALPKSLSLALCFSLQVIPAQAGIQKYINRLGYFLKALVLFMESNIREVVFITCDAILLKSLQVI